MIGQVTSGTASRARADQIDAILGEPTRRYSDGAVQGIPQAWAECNLIISHLAVGATTRIIAPLLTSKQADPGVVAIDDAGRFVVPLVGGHGGGANDLARAIADGLGATAVLTTATDSVGLPGLDTLGWHWSGDVAGVTRITGVEAGIACVARIGVGARRRAPVLPGSGIGGRTLVVLPCAAVGGCGGVGRRTEPAARAVGRLGIERRERLRVQRARGEAGHDRKRGEQAESAGAHHSSLPPSVSASASGATPPSAKEPGRGAAPPLLLSPDVSSPRSGGGSPGGSGCGFSLSSPVLIHAGTPCRSTAPIASMGSHRRTIWPRSWKHPECQKQNKRKTKDLTVLRHLRPRHLARRWPTLAQSPS